MTDHRLYTVTITRRSDMNIDTSQNRNVSELGAVAGGSSSIIPLGLGAGERVRQFQFGGYNDTLMAEMAAELTESESMEAVPFYGVSEDGTREPTREDGYYSVSAAGETRPDPRVSDFPTVNVTMKRVGTRNEHWRRIKSKPSLVENQWGNDMTKMLALPAGSTKAQWYDGDVGREYASPASTVTTEFGDVDVYHASDASYQEPDLIFELPYELEGRTDPNAWDTLGEDSRTSEQDGEQVLEWLKVFNRSHEFRGDAVLSNERVRLTVDEPAGTLAAEEYTGGSWGEVALPASDWEVLDLDLTTLDFSRVHGRIDFENTSSGTIYRLGLSLVRGATGFVWYVPENLYAEQGEVPQSLQDYLDPVASERITLMSPNQTVVKREEVTA